MQGLYLNLTDTLYQGVKARASKTNSTVEAEVIGAVEALLASDEPDLSLSQMIAEELAQLSFLDDAHLWQAASQVAPAEKNERMQLLAIKQQAEGLTESEKQEAQQLQQYAHRLMMIRAEAAVLLKRRGHDISVLRQSTTHFQANEQNSLSAP